MFKLFLISTMVFLAAAAPGKAQKTVVLVHGAFADGTSWEKVIPLLQAKGLKVVAVQNPLTSLADDVAATRRALDASTGPVILVGHSWAGTVITEAGAHDKVAALVYVAAFAPDAGQSSNDLGKDGPPPPGLANIRPDSAGFLSLTPESLARNFAQDLPPAQTAVMAVTQGPIFGKTFDEKVTNAAWKSKPSWYIVAEKDRMIQPDLERALAKKINARTTALPTSHVPMLSRPNDVATVILAARTLSNDLDRDEAAQKSWMHRRIRLDLTIQARTSSERSCPKTSNGSPSRRSHRRSAWQSSSGSPWRAAPTRSGSECRTV